MRFGFDSGQAFTSQSDSVVQRGKTNQCGEISQWIVAQFKAQMLRYYSRQICPYSPLFLSPKDSHICLVQMPAQRV